MTDGLIIPPGHGEQVGNEIINATFKVTGAHSRHTSVFENIINPGFDVGAHVHDRLEECFYVLEGELEVFAFEPVQRDADGWHQWRAADGRRPVQAGPGTCIFVPAGCPHAFRNMTDRPARVIQTASPPPDHELYLKAMAELFSAGAEVPQEAVVRLREAHDTRQLTPLTYRPPPATTTPT